MSPSQRFYHDLPVYVRRRTAQLQSCHILVEQKIENDKIAYIGRWSAPQKLVQVL
jgi:hypothetical protein